NTKHHENHLALPAVHDAISSVRRFYDCGCQSRAQFPDRMKYSAMPGEARRFNLNPEMLRKARLFASSYTPAEAEKLCAMARENQFPLGVSAIVRLVTIPRQQRAAFQRELIENRWSNK